MARLGMTMPRYSTSQLGPARRELLLAAAVLESYDVSSVWVPDLIGRSQFNPDPLTSLALAAAASDRISLGTAILQLPIREPFELATRVATTALVAQDRLSIGVGVGSTRHDFEATGSSYDDRFKTFREHVEKVRTLLNGGQISGHGIFPDGYGVTVPPFLLGTWGSRRWLEVAATEFDGWICSGKSGEIGKALEALEDYRRLGGKRAVITNVVLSPHLASDGLGLSPEDQRSVDRSIEMLKQLGIGSDDGFDEVVVQCRTMSTEFISAVAEIASRATQREESA